MEKVKAGESGYVEGLAGGIMLLIGITWIFGFVGGILAILGAAQNHIKISAR